MNRTIDHIDGQIFLGSGYHSQAQVGYLYGLISDALELINCMQQPPRPGSNDDCDAFEEQYKHDLRKLNKIASEVFIMLTGSKPRKKLKRKEKLECNE